MSSTYGENLKLSIFGQSHGAAIGMTLDGIPAGLPVDTDALQIFLNRRAPGQNDWSTPRKEADRPEFLSGILDGFTCGAPIAAAIYNKNTRSGDYANLKDCPPSRTRGPHRPDQIRRISGRRRGRTLFRPSDRAAVHRGRAVQTMAGRHGDSDFRPYRRHCRHFRHAL